MSLANKAAYILVIFCMIFTTVAYGAVHQPIIALFYVVVGAIVVLWAIDCYRSGAVRLSLHPLQLPLLAAALYGFFQVIPFGWYSIAGVGNIRRTISLDPYSTEITSIHLLALLLLFSMTLALIDRTGRIRQVVAIITIFGFVFAFFAILQGVLSPTKIYGIYERQFSQPYGSFVNRHNFAAYMEMTTALPLAMVLTGAARKDQRLLYLTAILLMAVALVLSGSRGGLVALMVELLMLVMITAPVRSSRKLILRLGVAAVILTAVIAGAIFVGGESSLTRIAETASSKDVSSNRTQIWSVTLDVIGKNFPFGAGIGAFGVAYTAVDPLSGIERAEQAHNDYLQVAADAGIIGVLIGGAFLFLLVSTLLKNYRTENVFRRAVVIGSAAGIFGVLVHSMFDFVLHTTAVSVLFLILTALLVNSGYKFEDDVLLEHDRSRRRGSVLPLRK